MVEGPQPVTHTPPSVLESECAAARPAKGCCGTLVLLPCLQLPLPILSLLRPIRPGQKRVQIRPQVFRVRACNPPSQKRPRDAGNGTRPVLPQELPGRLSL